MDGGTSIKLETTCLGSLSSCYTWRRGYACMSHQPGAYCCHHENPGPTVTMGTRGLLLSPWELGAYCCHHGNLGPTAVTMGTQGLLLSSWEPGAYCCHHGNLGPTAVIMGTWGLLLSPWVRAQQLDYLRDLMKPTWRPFSCKRWIMLTRIVCQISYIWTAIKDNQELETEQKKKLYQLLVEFIPKKMETSVVLARYSIALTLEMPLSYANILVGLPQQCKSNTGS